MAPRPCATTLAGKLVRQLFSSTPLASTTTFERESCTNDLTLTPILFHDDDARRALPRLLLAIQTHQLGSTLFPLLRLLWRPTLLALETRLAFLVNRGHDRLKNAQMTATRAIK